MGSYISLLDDSDEAARLASPDVCDDKTWENTLRNRSSYTVLDHLDFHAATQSVWDRDEYPACGHQQDSCREENEVLMFRMLQISSLSSSPRSRPPSLPSSSSSSLLESLDQAEHDARPRSPESTRRKRLGFAPDVVLVFDSERPASDVARSRRALGRGAAGLVDSESDDDENASKDALSWGFF
jgi:hypothetical protein